VAEAFKAWLDGGAEEEELLTSALKTAALFDALATNMPCPPGVSGRVRGQQFFRYFSAECSTAFIELEWPISIRKRIEALARNKPTTIPSRGIRGLSAL
jgi:hypothetical protein